MVLVHMIGGLCMLGEQWFASSPDRGALHVGGWEYCVWSTKFMAPRTATSNVVSKATG